MKERIVKYLAIGALGIASLVGGCSSDSGFELNVLNLKGGHQGALYRKGDDRTSSDFNIFKRDCSPYNRSSVSNGFFKHYDLSKEK